jgi:hypothetical protein
VEEADGLSEYGAIIRATNNYGETHLIVAIIINGCQDNVDLIIHHADRFGRRRPKSCIAVCRFACCDGYIVGQLLPTAVNIDSTNNSDISRLV